ncbi:ABC transporter ATP-binding protein [Candidatus Uabimicrobium amorphum]|uniref:Multidrug ABC transporter ATP-binding protein n=1 Tax=Uabimicrobium amorphum TaxID=2596890 RepID=A0A5S9IP50_UABAM|nr:ATP-binding cassette domain-containing protein [Candidatus Uabimicrobium amorphum]BBM85498.1 multidrug ABC transporter ATP-binding protein [Candidatus Uabimicrobium amorphum]
MIQAENLSMLYGPVTALDKANFEIKKGEVIGLLGPNGAGKSTTLKILTSYIYPTMGTAYVSGKDVRKDPVAVRKMIGYLPEQLPLYMDMEVCEYLRFVGNARGLYGLNLQKRLDWVVEKCGLKMMYRKIIRELSKGYKQRTALAQALLHDPEIIILDEPTSGLDPHQILEIRALINELAQEKTVIFSTHILQEIEAITDHIIVINRGKIVANGTIPDIRKQALAHQRLQLAVEKDTSSDDVKKALEEIDHIEKVEHQDRNDEIVYTIESSNEKNPLADISKLVREKSWNFTELKRHPLTLEEVFLALTVNAKGEKA